MILRQMRLHHSNVESRGRHSSVEVSSTKKKKKTKKPKIKIQDHYRQVHRVWCSGAGFYPHVNRICVLLAPHASFQSSHSLLPCWKCLQRSSRRGPRGSCGYHTS